jgi:uncharacterized coiled-coil protein SlyX
MMQPTTPTVFDDIPLPQPNESRYAMDSKLYIEFYRKPVMHHAKSKEAGRAIYEEVDYIRIHTPGDKSSVIDKPITALDIQRFSDRYNKWKAGQAEAVTGTPLTALPGITPSKAEEYKFFKIVTIEQLADAPDNLGQKFMSFQQDKSRAKAFMEVAANNAPIERMNEELQKRDQVIEDMQAQLEALKAQIKPKRQVAATADAE